MSLEEGQEANLVLLSTRKVILLLETFFCDQERLLSLNMECSLPVNLTNAAYFVAVNNIMYLNLTTIQNMLGITSSTTPTLNTTFIVPFNKRYIFIFC